MPRDPICGMYVDESSESIASQRDGRRYYFCSTGCKDQFNAPIASLARNRKLTALAWIVGIAIVLITYFLSFSYRSLALLALGTIVQFYPGLTFYRGTLDALRNHAANMDTLIAVGTSTAYLYSAYMAIIHLSSPHATLFFDASVIIIALIRTGSLIDESMRERANEGFMHLYDSLPSTARVIRNGIEMSVPVDDVMENETVMVRSGEQIPVDGKVLQGEGEADLSIITGESKPVHVAPGDSVPGGAISLNGALLIRSVAPGSENTLSRIVDMTLRARESTTSVQKMADRISKYFVPMIIAAALSSFLFWFFIGHVGLTFSLLVFVSVIVIACPCALGIATPAAMSVASSVGSRSGIVVVDGKVFERISKLDIVAFDKTGTITSGRPVLSDFSAFSGDRNGVLSKLASLEAGSNHPFASAILERARAAGVPFSMADGISEISGRGIEGAIDGVQYWAGNMQMLAEKGVANEAVLHEMRKKLDEGHSIVILGSGQDVLGYALLDDMMRPEAPMVVSTLRAMNIESIMLTGDNEVVASRVAAAAGIEHFHAGIGPSGKLGIIEELRQKGHTVCFVGDGINDAPALAKADVGIALSSATDAAKSAGHILLLRNTLMDVVNALSLGRKTMSKIRQNLFWAFVYNVCLVPVAAGALVPALGIGIYDYMPFVSALAMAVSSATVVTNSLLLNRFHPELLEDRPGVSIHAASG